MRRWLVVSVVLVVAALAIVVVVVLTDPRDDEPETATDPRRDAPPIPATVGDDGPTPVTDREGSWLDARDVAGVDCAGGSADDLQAAVDRAAGDGLTLVIPEGARCKLDAPLEIPDGARIHAGGAVVTGLPGAFRPRPERESLVDIIGVSDVRVHGGLWQMAEDEGANVFEIRDSSDVVLAGLTATGAREDGFYIGRPTSVGVRLERVVANENGRSGISITTGRDISVVGSHAHDNGHITDMRGLTIEPTSDGGPLTGIRIVDLVTSGNYRSGASASLANLDADAEDVDIVFDGYRSIDDPIGLRVSKGMVGGVLRIVDAEFHQTDSVALQLKDRWASAFRVEIIRPVIRDWGTDPAGRPRHDSAISIYTSDDDVDEPLGGVRIVEPTITAHPDAGSDAYYVYVGDNRDEPVGVEDVELLDPVHLEYGRGLSLQGEVRVGTEDPSAEASLLPARGATIPD